MAGADLKTYRGNCHCGRFVYELDIPEIKGYEYCNCSICHKKGYAWLFPEKDEQLRFVKGSMEDLAVYSFGSGNFNGNFSHRFCSDCGTAVMGDNPNAETHLYVNARTIQNLNIWSLEVKTFDGKALPPSRDPPAYKGPEPTVEVEDGKIYHGSCHCGAVTVALKFKQLDKLDPAKDEDRVVDCNCSICVRGAYLWIYAGQDQSVVQGRENLSYRVFGHNIMRKAFCKHCGVHICNEPLELTDEQVAALSEYVAHRRNKSINNRNLNLRILDGFDCTTLETRKLDGWNLMKEDFYVNP